MAQLTRRALLRSAAALAVADAWPVRARTLSFAEQFPLPWRRVALSNGANLYLAPTASQHVAASFRVRYGEVNELAGEDGLAHLLEHVIGKGGAGPYSHGAAKEMRNALPEENATTTLEHVAFTGAFNRDQLAGFLDLTAQCVFAPHLESRVLEQERMRVVEELSAFANEKAFHDLARFDRALYGADHPLATFEPAAEIATASRATRSNLKAFHARFGRANLLDLFLVGGLPRDVAVLVERHVGGHRTPGGTCKRVPPVRTLAGRVIIGPLDAPDLMAGRSAFKLGWNTRAFFGHPDTAALTLALKHLKARLEEAISDALGMVYDISLSFEPSRYEASVTIEAATQADPRRAIDAILSVIAETRTAPMTESQMRQKQIHLRFHASRRMQDTDEVLERLERYADYGTSYFEAGLARVTPEQAMRAAHVHFPAEDGAYVALIRQGRKSER